jgi:glycosyltransferase involved in cell wall biosynthesis
MVLATPEINEMETRQNFYNPLVSVIIPMFNSEEYIADTLSSVLGQTYKNIEIIVVDDASTDNSKEVVSLYGTQVTCVSDGKKRGYPSMVRNLGLLHAKGELFTFFDSDDLMLPHKLEAQVNFLRKHPDVSAAVVDYVNFTEQGEFDKTHFQTCPNLSNILKNVPEGGSIILTPLRTRSILTEENFASLNSLLLRKCAIDEVGALDEDLMIGEDFELVYRIAMKQGIGIVNTVGFKRRIHENNLMIKTKMVKKLIETKKTREKILSYEEERCLRKRLKGYIRGAQISLCDEYIGVDNKAALKELLRGFSLTEFKLLQFKEMVKIVLSLLGISTEKMARMKQGLSRFCQRMK